MLEQAEMALMALGEDRNKPLNRLEGTQQCLQRTIW